jgi:N-acetylneuraminate synthase
LSTPFSPEAVDLLESIDVPAYKIGSGDVSNSALLNSIITTQKPILLSSGMSSYEELQNTVNQIETNNIQFGVFQCTTSYPCNPEDIGYNILDELGKLFNVPIGLSDHSGTIYPSLAATALNANMFEVHAVFSKDCFGPDTSSSLTIEELKRLVEGIRFIEQGIGKIVDKNAMSNARSETKQLFSRSAFFARNMQKGDVLEKSSFKMKKPGGGMNYELASGLIGKKLTVDKEFDDFLNQGDFE